MVTESIKLKKSDVTAKINPENGQLYSLKRSEDEKKQVMWPGGAPEKEKHMDGWPNSEIIAFPIFGPTGGKITYNGEEYPMGQHGLSRRLPWSQVKKTEYSITFIQHYIANEIAPDGSKFPVSFDIEKTYEIAKDGRLIFSVTVTNEGEERLSYALGWHPAFQGSGIVKYQGSEYETREIYSEDKNVRKLIGVNSVVFENDSYILTLESNFHNTVLWVPQGNLIAIEPVSAMPIENTKNTDLLRADGYRGIDPHHSASYKVILRIE
jgi:D-hexose-6-phosphate mutarotase